MYVKGLVRSCCMLFMFALYHMLAVVFFQDYESFAVCSIKNDSVSAEFDETQSDMKPVIALETLDLAQ